MAEPKTNRKRSSVQRVVYIIGEIVMKIAAILFSLAAMTVGALAQATVSPKGGLGMHYDNIRQACVVNSGWK
jgi:hypothetical protein